MSEEEQREYYSSGEYREEIAKKIADDREIALQKARAMVVSKQVQGFRIESHLDVGCSTGELLRVIAEGKGKKFRSIGVDPDPKWPGGVKRLYKDIREVKGKFDLITIIQVLEHLNKPQEMMREIKDRLSPGGLVVVEVPNRRCYLTAYDSPKHVVAYDLLSLGRLMVKAGLDVMDFALQDYLHDGPLDMYISMLVTNDRELCRER
jgi:2-polyprenyl-3-methyl-5-hydroxy-6-metoxy-1,4-benzoquinol methylase